MAHTIACRRDGRANLGLALPAMLLLLLCSVACGDSAHTLGRALDAADGVVFDAGTGAGGTGGGAGAGGRAGSGGSGGSTSGTGGSTGSGGTTGTGGATGSGGSPMMDGGVGQLCSGKQPMECEPGMVCDLDVPGRCLASTAGGHCIVVPVSCQPANDPVCGCDGRTYVNDCERRRSRTELDHAGSCAAPDGGGPQPFCGATTCLPSELCVHLCTCALPGCQNPPPSCGAVPPSCANPIIANGQAHCTCPP